MQDIINTTSIQFACGAVAGWLGLFFGGMDGLMYALILFVVCDYITGVMCAISEHKLSSEIGFRGIFRKVVILGLVGVGHALDGNVFGGGDTARSAVAFFYLANEGISILENAARLGLPVPQKIRTILEQLSDDKDDTKGDGAE